MPLVDTHCHLQDSKFNGDRAEVLYRALELLDWLVVIGDDLESSEAAVQLTEDRVFATVGVHPYHAGSVDDELLVRLRELASHRRVVGIGEIGLDYFKYNQTPREVQIQALNLQLQLAADLRLPVVIHNRDSTEDLCAVLGDHADKLVGGVIHCFAGSVAFAEFAVTHGFHVSFAGNVTYPKAEELRTAARALPLSRILIETDAPYLAPQAVRGARCEPAFVRHTAAYLAEHLGVDFQEFCEHVSRNAAKLFHPQAD